MTSCPTFAISATVKAPPDELRCFVAHHLAQGAARIFLFFDDPGDDCAALFTDPRVSVIRCDEAHWRRLELANTGEVNARRSANAMAAIKMARTEGITWLAVIDHDELLHSQIPLSRVFASAPGSTQVLRFEVWEALADDEDHTNPFNGAGCFKWHPLPLNVARGGSWIVYLQWLWFLAALKLAGLLGARRANRRQFTIGHRSGKSAVRTDAQVAGFSSHVPLPPPGRTLRMRRAAGAALLHYDGIGFDSWRWKWQHRLDALARISTLPASSPDDSSKPSFEPLMRPHRMAYLQEFSSASAAGESGLRDFYQATRRISRRDRRILAMLGLVRHMPPVDFH